MTTTSNRSSVVQELSFPNPDGFSVDLTLDGRRIRHRFFEGPRADVDAWVKAWVERGEILPEPSYRQSSCRLSG